MATEAELCSALKRTLEANGAIEGVRARLRAEVFAAVRDDTAQPPPVSREQMLINELIREYLTFSRYGYTESVFVPEAGLDAEPLSREYVADELNLEDTPRSAGVPLLYGIVSLLSSGALASSVGAAGAKAPAPRKQ